MDIAVDADNAFNLGWVACLLGLPRNHPNPPRDGYQTEFQDGWDMCKETSKEFVALALPKMIENKQLSAHWVVQRFDSDYVPKSAMVQCVQLTAQRIVNGMFVSYFLLVPSKTIKKSMEKFQELNGAFWHFSEIGYCHHVDFNEPYLLLTEHEYKL